MFDEITYILGAEYLMAILLQTGRPIDRERLLRFFDEVDYDKNLLQDLIIRFNLLTKYESFKEKLL